MLNKIVKILPAWSIGIISILFIIIVISIIIIMTVLVFTRKIKSKWFSIENKSINLEIFPLIFRETIRVQREIDHNDFKARLSEQMSYLEDKIKDIHEEILKAYRHFLQAKGITKNQSDSHPQIKCLDKIIKNMLIILKLKAKRRFDEMTKLFQDYKNLNDDYNYIKADFEQYMDRVMESMITDARNFVREEWVDDDYFIIASKEKWNELKKSIKKKAALRKEILQEVIDSELEVVNRRDSWNIVRQTLSENGKAYKEIKEIFKYAIQIQLKYSNIEKKLNIEIDNFIKKLESNV